MKLSYPAKIGAGVGVVIGTPVVVVGLVVALAVGLTGLPDGAAFRVDDTVVTTDQLDDRLEVLEALYGIAAPPDPQGREQFRRESAMAIAVSMVLDGAAVDEGIVVSDAEVREGFGRFVKERFPDGKAGLAKLLGTVGASEPDVLDEIRRQLVTARLYDKIGGPRAVRAELPEEQVRRFYDENVARFSQPETRRLSYIVVSSQERADEVLGRARSGSNFAELAREFSLDDVTRDTGGDLQFVARAQLTDAFAEAAFGTPTGGLFGPVESENGWNVGQVGEIRAAVRPPYEQVSGKVRNALTTKLAADTWRSWVTDQIVAAGVSYAAPYRPVNPALLPDVQPDGAPVAAQEGPGR